MTATLNHNESTALTEMSADFPSGYRWRLQPNPVRDEKFCGMSDHDKRELITYTNSTYAIHHVCYWFTHGEATSRWNAEQLTHDQRMTRLSCMLAGLGYSVEWTEVSPISKFGRDTKYAARSKKGKGKICICESTPVDKQEDALWELYREIAVEQAVQIDVDNLYEAHDDARDRAIELAWPPTAGNRRDGGADCPYCGKNYITERPFRRHVDECFGYPAIGRIEPAKH